MFNDNKKRFFNKNKIAKEVKDITTSLSINTEGRKLLKSSSALRKAKTIILPTYTSIKQLAQDLDFNDTEEKSILMKLLLELESYELGLIAIVTENLTKTLLKKLCKKFSVIKHLPSTDLTSAINEIAIYETILYFCDHSRELKQLSPLATLYEKFFDAKYLHTSFLEYLKSIDLSWESSFGMQRNNINRLEILGASPSDPTRPNISSGYNNPLAGVLDHVGSVITPTTQFWNKSVNVQGWAGELTWESISMLDLVSTAESYVIQKMDRVTTPLGAGKTEELLFGKSHDLPFSKPTALFEPGGVWVLYPNDPYAAPNFSFYLSYQYRFTDSWMRYWGPGPGAGDFDRFAYNRIPFLYNLADPHGATIQAIGEFRLFNTPSMTESGSLFNYDPQASDMLISTDVDKAWNNFRTAAGRVIPGIADATLRKSVMDFGMYDRADNHRLALYLMIKAWRMASRVTLAVRYINDNNFAIAFTDPAPFNAQGQINANCFDTINFTVGVGPAADHIPMVDFAELQGVNTKAAICTANRQLIDLRGLSQAEFQWMAWAIFSSPRLWLGVAGRRPLIPQNLGANPPIQGAPAFNSNYVGEEWSYEYVRGMENCTVNDARSAVMKGWFTIIGDCGLQSVQPVWLTAANCSNTTTAVSAINKYLSKFNLQNEFLSLWHELLATGATRAKTNIRIRFPRHGADGYAFFTSSRQIQTNNQIDIPNDMVKIKNYYQTLASIRFAANYCQWELQHVMKYVRTAPVPQLAQNSDDLNHTKVYYGNEWGPRVYNSTALPCLLAAFIHKATGYSPVFALQNGYIPFDITDPARLMHENSGLADKSMVSISDAFYCNCLLELSSLWFLTNPFKTDGYWDTFHPQVSGRMKALMAIMRWDDTHDAQLNAAMVHGNRYVPQFADAQRVRLSGSDANVQMNLSALFGPFIAASRLIPYKIILVDVFPIDTFPAAGYNGGQFAGSDEEGNEQSTHKLYIAPATKTDMHRVNAYNESRTSQLAIEQSPPKNVTYQMPPLTKPNESIPQIMTTSATKLREGLNLEKPEKRNFFTPPNDSPKTFKTKVNDIQPITKFLKPQSYNTPTKNVSVQKPLQMMNIDSESSSNTEKNDQQEERKAEKPQTNKTPEVTEKQPNNDDDVSVSSSVSQKPKSNHSHHSHRSGRSGSSRSSKTDQALQEIMKKMNDLEQKVNNAQLEIETVRKERDVALALVNTKTMIINKLTSQTADSVSKQGGQINPNDHIIVTRQNEPEQRTVEAPKKKQKIAERQKDPVFYDMSNRTVTSDVLFLKIYESGLDPYVMGFSSEYTPLISEEAYIEALAKEERGEPIEVITATVPRTQQEGIPESLIDTGIAASKIYGFDVLEKALQSFKSYSFSENQSTNVGMMGPNMSVDAISSVRQNPVQDKVLQYDINNRPYTQIEADVIRAMLFNCLLQSGIVQPEEAMRINTWDYYNPDTTSYCGPMCLLFLGMNATKFAAKGYNMTSKYHTSSVSDIVKLLEELSLLSRVGIIANGSFITSVGPSYANFSAFMIGHNSHWRIIIRHDAVNKVATGYEFVGAGMSKVVSEQCNICKERVPRDLVQDIKFNLTSKRYDYFGIYNLYLGSIDFDSTETFYKPNNKYSKNRIQITLYDAFELILSRITSCVLSLEEICIILAYNKGAHECRISTFLTYIATVEFDSIESVRKFIATNRVFDCCLICFIDHLKHIHESIKLEKAEGIDELTLEDQTKLMYLHSLNGRTHSELDWADELDKRVNNRNAKPKVWVTATGDTNEIAFTTNMDIILNDLFHSIKFLRPLSAKQLMATAPEYVVGGSFFDDNAKVYKKELNDKLEAYEIKGLKINKRSILFSKYYDKCSTIPERIKTIKPRLKTKCHMKIQEHTKARAIYQTTMTHYIIATYFFSCITTSMRHINFTKNLKSDEMVTRIARRQYYFDTRSTYNSYDFEDFNSQHTFEHMKMVIRKILEWGLFKISFRDDEDREFFIQCGLFLIKSIDMTYTVFEDKSYIWKAGMPSGVRYTSDMNDILNYVYTTTVKSNLESLKQGRFLDDYFEVCGDDSIHTFKSMHHANQFNELMVKAGFVAQVEKQQVSYNRFEYLRIQHYKNGLVMGCLARNIPNMVNGNWENEGFVALKDIVMSNVNNIMLLCRRGMVRSVSQRLISIIIRNTIKNAFSMAGEDNIIKDNYEAFNQFIKTIEIVRKTKLKSMGWDMLLPLESYIMNKNTTQLVACFTNIIKDIDIKLTLTHKQSDMLGACKVVKDYKDFIINWAANTLKIEMKDMAAKVKNSILTSAIVETLIGSTETTEKPVTEIFKIFLERVSTKKWQEAIRQSESKPFTYENRVMMPYSDKTFKFSFCVPVDQWAAIGKIKQKVDMLNNELGITKNHIRYLIIERSLTTDDSALLRKGLSIESYIPKEISQYVKQDKKGKYHMITPIRSFNICEVPSDLTHYATTAFMISREEWAMKILISSKLTLLKLNYTIRF